MIIKFNFTAEWYFGVITSIVGFYTISHLIEHRRLENETQNRFKAHRIIMALASIVFATTTWCHYAFSLAAFSFTSSGVDFNADAFVVQNDNLLSNALISISVGFVSAFLSLFLSSHDQFFSSTNDQRVEILRAMFRKQTQKITIRELKRRGKAMVRMVALTRRSQRHLLSGAITTASQLFTRLLMFRNTSIDGLPYVQLRWGHIVLAWVFASLFSCAGFWGLFRMLSWKRYEWLRFGSAMFLMASAVLVEWLSLSCINFSWTSPTSPSTFASSFHSVEQYFVFFPVLGGVMVICIFCLWIINFELRVNYLQIMTDFAKLINLMDAAYVSAHVTHNFERSFETFINSALPLMASHTKITEAAFENYELSRSRNNSMDSSTSSRHNTAPTSRNSKAVKLLGVSGAKMVEFAMRAKGSFSFRKLSKSVSLRNLRMKGSARVYATKTTSQRVIPLDNAGLQASPETNNFTSQRVMSMDNSNSPLFTSLEPPHMIETPISLLRNDGRLSRKASTEFNVLNSSLASVIPKIFCSTSNKGSPHVTSKQESASPEPANIDVMKIPESELPCPITVKHLTAAVELTPVHPKRNSLYSKRNSLTQHCSATPESLLEKIARYQIEELRRSRSPEKSKGHGVLNLIMDTSHHTRRRSTSRPNDRKAVPLATETVPTRRGSFSFVPSAISSLGNHKDVPQGINRVSRPKAFSTGADALSRSSLDLNMSSKISGIESVRQSLLNSSAEAAEMSQLVYTHLEPLDIRRNSSDGNLNQTSLQQPQTPHSGHRTSRGSVTTKYNLLVFPDAQQHSIRPGASEPNLNAFSDNGSQEVLLTTNTSPFKEKDLNMTPSARMRLQSISPHQLDHDSSSEGRGRLTNGMGSQTVHQSGFNHCYFLGSEQFSSRRGSTNPMLSARVSPSAHPMLSARVSPSAHPMLSARFRHCSDEQNFQPRGDFADNSEDINSNRDSLSTCSSGDYALPFTPTTEAQFENSNYLETNNLKLTTSKHGCDWIPSESNMH